VALLLAAAAVLLVFSARGEEPSKAAAVPLLPRGAVVPVSVVTQYFPEVTKESSTGPNETRVGKPVATRSVVFTSADGKKKVTLSVDQYADVSDAASAYQTAVQGSKAAPGFEPAAAPNLGQEAFAGTSQVGAERHFGLGARDGALIMSATHAGDIPVTPYNSNKLANLGAVELTTAKKVLEPSTAARATGNGRVTIVYLDDAILPENRDAIRTIRESGVFERMADRLTAAVALPHDLQVVVTDDLPEGVDDPTTELDGRRIF
jgi:hypothetical protein